MVVTDRPAEATGPVAPSAPGPVLDRRRRVPGRHRVPDLRRPRRQRRLLPHGARGRWRCKAEGDTGRFRLAGNVVPGTVQAIDGGVQLLGDRREPGRRGATTTATRPSSSRTAPPWCARAAGTTSFALLRVRRDPHQARRRVHAAVAGRVPLDDRSRDEARPRHAGPVGGLVRRRHRRRPCSCRAWCCGDRRRVRAGRRCVYVVLFAAVAAAGIMEWALLSDDFSLQYVVDHHARATPTLFTIASLWGALEGSILLWILILAGYMTYAPGGSATGPTTRSWAGPRSPSSWWRRSSSRSMMWPANPFQEVAGIVPRDGAGPNPLLQNHVLMAFHPPMLYLGYVGMTVPFSFGDRRARHRAPRRGLAGRHPAGDARGVGLPHHRHHPRRRGGATRCSAGAATGRGTRSRTRRSCRGSPPPRSSTR